MNAIRNLSLSPWKNLLVTAYRDWSEDGASTLGAALAFYTMLSLAPLLVIVIAVAGFMFGREAAQGELMGQLAGLVGPDGAKAIEVMIAGAQKKTASGIASVLGILTLIYGATSVVAELRKAMNRILEVPTDPNSGIKEVLKQRSYAIGLVLSCGFLLTVSLVVSAALAVFGKFVDQYLPAPEFVLHVMNFAVSLVMITGIFALLFRYLPDIRLRWRDVFVGAAFTAVLFTIGKFLIGMYLGKAGFGSTFGAAGSLVIVLVWVYYSTQIFFFGAELTQAYGNRFGSLQQQESSKGREVKPTPSPAPAGHQRPAPVRSRSVPAVIASVALIGAHFLGIFRRCSHARNGRTTAFR